MLPRSLRIRRSGFPLRAQMRRVSTPHFTISIAHQSVKSGAAIIVSKKVAPRAVDRHLLKRRIAVIIRPFIRPSIALVVHPKVGARALTFGQIKSELVSVLQTLA